MKPKLLALFLLISVGVKAQTKQVSHSDYFIGQKEVYNVLTANKTVREGEYKLFGTNGKGTLWVEGYYHNNLKDSTWKYYSQGQLASEGQYKNGGKTGVWIGYTRGFERLKYDFDKQQLANYVPNPLDSVQQFSIINAMGADTILDRTPIFINGMAAFKLMAQRNIRYPFMALGSRAQGEAIVTFTIDEKGTPGNYAVKTNLGYGLDAAALKGIEQIGGEWVPGTIKGKLVPVQCEIPVLFAISSDRNVYIKPNTVLILVMPATVIR